MNGIAAIDRASRDAGAGRSGIRTRAHRRCPAVRHRLLRGGARLLARLALPRVRAPGPERVGDDLDGAARAGARLLTSAGGVGIAIADVAAMCGFRETPTFSRMFRRHYGLTPTDAREGRAAGLIAPALFKKARLARSGIKRRHSDNRGHSSRGSRGSPARGGETVFAVFDGESPPSAPTIVFIGKSVAKTALKTVKTGVKTVDRRRGLTSGPPCTWRPWLRGPRPGLASRRSRWCGAACR